MPNTITRLYTLLPGGTPIPGVSLPDRASLPDPATLRVPIRGVSQNGRRGTTPAAGGASVHHSAGVARSRVPIGKREGQRGAGLRRCLGRGGCSRNEVQQLTLPDRAICIRGEREEWAFPQTEPQGMHRRRTPGVQCLRPHAAEGGHCVEAQGNGTSRVSRVEWCVCVCIRRCVYGAFPVVEM